MSLIPVELPEEISDPADKMDPFPWFERMRRSEPVRYDPSRGVWDVFKYEHVCEVLSNHELYAVGEVPLAVNPDDPLARSMMFSDSPRHEFLHRAGGTFFKPSTIDGCESIVRAQARRHIDRKVDEGELDVRNDLGFPVSFLTVAELMGIPKEEQMQFVDYAAKLMRGRSLDGKPTRNPGAVRNDFVGYLTELIAEQRENPRDGLISHLLAAEVDGTSLDDDDLFGFCEMLLVGGAVPPYMLTNAVYSFAQVDGLIDQLTGDERALEMAIEESLRYRSSTQVLPRVARTDTRLGGEEIEAGDMLFAWIASANRDEDVFERPDVFEYDRNPDDHVAFGTGRHFCLGARLARLQGRVVLSELFDRLDDIRIRQDELEPEMTLVGLGFASMPIAFDAE